MEETLHFLYKGQTNVALAAQKENISTEQMKQIFAEFVARTPIDSELWQRDVELFLPYA